MLERYLVKGKGRSSSSLTSYFGGPSYLPPAQALPVCAQSDQPMTLFLHLHFPSGHPYEGRSLELFASTTFQKDALDFPEVATFGSGPKDISEPALRKNQAMYRACLFDADAGALRDDYQAPLKQRFIDLVDKNDVRGMKSKLGGEPVLRDDELVPRTILGRPAVFLFQLQGRLRYPRVAGGPDQVVGGTRRRPLYGEQTFFELFQGSKLYAFGTEEGDPSEVYLLCLR